ncbi:MAG: Ku protein [Candidatus Aenigmarchaeota archaeon]|nr:Ku protein [Candidatus Aenigmarchaeota archaeon]
MVRAIFSGSISFGLVNIPIKIYPATESRVISFNNLHKECGTPLVYKRWCPKCEKEVAYEDIEKGYKITKEKYVIIKKEDLEKLRLKTTKAIEIQEFVDASQIDPIFLEKSYYVVPEETGIKAYSLFVEALRIANKVAIGKVVMRNKEYLVAIRAFKKGLVMHILHYLGEIKDIEELSELKSLVTVREEELRLAQALISKLTESEFDASKFKDNYTEELMKLIKARAEGKEIEVKEEKVPETKELVEALKASIESTKKRKEEKK